MLGRPIAASLYPVSYQDAAGLKVTGLVAAPECSRSAASHLYTYINGRFIKDKVVQHAILQAYRNFLERGRYPVVAVFIEIPPGEVDVNVHPTKHEVRFREQGRVHDAIQGAVESVLRETPWLKRGGVQQTFGKGAPQISGGAASQEKAAALPTYPGRVAAAPPEGVCSAPSGASAARVAEVRELLVDFKPRPQPPLRPYLQPPPAPRIAAEDAQIGGSAYRPSTPLRDHPSTPLSGPVTTEGASTPLSERVVSESLRGETEAECVAQIAAETANHAIEVREETNGYFSSLSVIGQFNAAYILCQQGTDLVLIDQHAAHERVAFERLKGEFAGKAVDSQGLLFPETMELSFRESAVLLENIDELGRLGFALEEFGGNTWLLKGVPQILAGTEYLRTIRDILEELGSLSRSRTFSDVQEDILARVACHSVVRGRRTLTQQEIVALFGQMDRTDFSSNCPHGRPVMQRITLAEMEKMFKRG
jgi:DNA mismatch repair protein MutL